MSSHDEDEDNGPSVDSLVAEERIAARRLRIQRRLEDARRQASGEDTSQKKPVDSEKDALKSRKQMEDSRQRLLKLKTDGTELVTNVSVAADAREAMRRLEEEEARRQRNEKLEAEAKSAAEKFEEVTKKWEYALSKEIPQDLHGMLTEQKTACDAMVEEKDKLINDFQQELKGKDDQYVKDLKRAAEDIDLVIEREEEQIKQLTKAYREELTQIEKAFVTERGELLDNNSRKWETAMQQRRDKENEYMDARRKRVEDYENQLQTLRIQDAEEYNMVKIKLETDVQILEQQLQQMKATYQLNQEKLEYNFQVLKKRDEENTITKSQQKRKITRLQDVLNNLKQKLSKQERQYREENQGLTDDYKRITEQFRELQKKYRHFQTTDQKKYVDIWAMNEEQVRDLVGNVLGADRIICEHQLGLPWEPHQLELLEKPTIHKESFSQRSEKERSEKEREHQPSATQVAHDIMTGVTTDEEGIRQEQSVVSGSVKDSESRSYQPKLPAKVIKSILELVCDESGFLVESKLNTLLAPLDKDEQSLMKLDAIFAALGVDTEDDIYLLAQYFIDKHTDNELEGTEATEQPDINIEKEKTKIAEEEKTEKQEMDGAGDDGISSEKSSVSVKKTETVKLIHPNDVTAALRIFVENHKQPQKEAKRHAMKLDASSSTRDFGADSQFWEKMVSVIDDRKDHLWNALLGGFDKYLGVLTERAGLIQETDALRQQNAELRMLLHQYVNSRVNQELEIPPTKILQAELSKESSS